MPEIYGVSPQFSARSGLTNQEYFVHGLFALAYAANASISLPTLRWAGSLGAPHAVHVPHEALFDVAPWRAAVARGELPPFTDAPPTRSFGEGSLWRAVTERQTALIRSGALRRPSLDEAFARFALEPSAQIRKAVAAVQPPRPFACLHARVELDAAASRTHIDAGYVRFGRLATILRGRGPPAGATSLFVAVARRNVAEADAALLTPGASPVWPDVPLRVGGVDAALGQGFNDDSAYVAGGVIDKRVCLSADVFIGCNWSTFSNSIVYGRLVRGAGSSFVYSPRGVRRRRDDGRLDGVLLRQEWPRPEESARVVENNIFAVERLKRIPRWLARPARSA